MAPVATKVKTAPAAAREAQRLFFEIGMEHRQQVGAALGKLELTKSGSSGGTLTFDRWNEPLTITAPAGAIDIPALRSGR